MQSNQLFNKVFQELREPTIMKKMSQTLANETTLLSSIHKTAVDNPEYDVKKVLKLNNCSYLQYRNLIKTGYSIPQVRKLTIGKSRVYSPQVRQSKGIFLQNTMKNIKKKKLKDPKDCVGKGSDDGDEHYRNVASSYLH